jgi:aspartyl-tRNA(Asn)/glutamyl-tRNA(Gln) amidotransferase subunit A
MSVPFGESQDGLPIGIQLTANHFEEQKMLDVGYALENAAPVKGKNPNVI